MFKICKHEWEVVVNEFTESNMEQLIRLGTPPKEFYHWMLEKTKIIILKCSKCGKLDKTTKEV